MSKSLVIVESPAKAKTINKYLGRDYVVKASMGHVRDLPKTKLGVDIENDFEPKYQTIRGKSKLLTELRQAAKKAEKVFLAPDLDREGEAIAWHLVAALKLPEEKIFRVTFNEITKNAVRDAFKNPTKIDLGRVNAQQARRVLDRIVGYKISPLLWAKVTKGLSAGRVQSVAVKLIVEREREIQAFTPTEYWEVDATVAPADRLGETFTAKLKKIDGKDLRKDDATDNLLPNEETTTALLKRIENKPWAVENIELKETRESAPPPFITSTLAQQGSIALRYSTRKTMMLAQQLYEGIDLGKEGSVGLITYMRTDSVRVSDQALGEVRELIGKDFGADYVPDKPNTFRAKKGAQEAHEAIRPTSATYTPTAIKQYLSKDQFALYKLIWTRFVASQMSAARYNVGNADIVVEDCLFKATGKELVFDGYTKLVGHKLKEGQQILPTLEAGGAIQPTEVLPSQHFTKPPPRYSEATLISALEKNGIGRPSTYSPIISTIQSRGYVKTQERRFHATDLGMLVTDLLLESFADIMDTEFTSKMEAQLDEIEESGADWVEVLNGFYKLFAADLEKADVSMTNVKENEESTGKTCELCGEAMIFRWSRRGRFIGCSGFPDCKNTMAIDEDGNVVEMEKTDEVCEKCEKPMMVRSGRNGKFLGCTGYPECRNTKPMDGKDEAEGLTPEQLGTCDKCNAAMVVKRSRRGPFLACSAYPECKNAKPLPKDLQPEPEAAGEDCPECGSPMLIKVGRRGKFVACSAYPKCKTTKPWEAGEAPAPSSAK